MADLSKRTRSVEWHREHQSGHNGHQVTSLALESTPTHGDTWGHWRLDTKRLVLEYLDDDGRWQYEFDLETEHHPASMLEFILQVNGKAWAKVEDIGDFVQALDDLVGNSQAVFCAFGVARMAKPSEVYKRRTGSLRT